WAFGAVLMEMLTGRRVFAGDSTPDVIAEVLKSEPDWTALPSETPQRVRTLLRRCLTKDARNRLDSAAAARPDLPRPHDHTRDERAGRTARHRATWWAAATVAGILAVAAAVASWSLSRKAAAASAPNAARFVIAPPRPGQWFPGDMDLSPDGKQIAA